MKRPREQLALGMCSADGERGAWQGFWPPWRRRRRPGGVGCAASPRHDDARASLGAGNITPWPGEHTGTVRGDLPGRGSATAAVSSRIESLARPSREHPDLWAIPAQLSPGRASGPGRCRSDSTSAKMATRLASRSQYSHVVGASRIELRMPRPMAAYDYIEITHQRTDMNLLTLLFRLPLMPLRGFVQLGEALHDHAEQELRDPASVRRQLEQAEQARVAGQISDEDLAHVQGQAVGRLLS